MAGKWEYFEKGLVGNAGIEIRRISLAGWTQDETRYEVRYLCCNRQSVLSHRQVRKRINSRSERCRACGQLDPSPNPKRKKRLDPSRDYPPLEIPNPEWAVPESTKNVRLRW